jgi:hypothetical protein
MPYHNNPQMLARHFGLWADLPRYIRNNIEFLICDDASNEPASFPDWYDDPSDFNVRIFRIDPPHVPWSHRCATNIAAHYATGAYVIVTDIDHMIDADAWASLFSVDWLQSDKVYTFKRRNYFDGVEYKPHPDSWLMSRELWGRIGGYDTRYRGYYGQNFPFIERVKCHAKIEQLGVTLTRVTRDDVLDASERVLERKSDHARRMIATMRQKFKTEGTFLQRGEILPHREV